VAGAARIVTTYGRRYGLINREAFEYIEIVGKVTPEMMANKLGMQKGTAAAWLSRWCQAGYLERVAGDYVKKTGRPGGYYTITPECKWWGERGFPESGW